MKPILLLIFMIGFPFLVSAQCNCTETNTTVNETVEFNQTFNETVNETEGNETIELNNTLEFSCDVRIGFSLEKNTFDSGEKVKFHNTLTNKSYDFEIEYWIEDLYGEIIKRKVVTTNLNAKSYTPKIDVPEKIFILKNELLSVDCPNIAQSLESEFIFAVKNEGVLEENTQDELTNLTQNIIPEATKIVSLERPNLPEPAKEPEKEEMPEINTGAASLSLPEQLPKQIPAPERNINVEPSTVLEEPVYTSTGEKAKSKSIYIITAVLALAVLGFTFKNGIFTKSNHRSRRLSEGTRRRGYGKGYGKAKG